MKKNSLLNIALFILKIGQILCIVSFVLLLGTLTYSKLTPEVASKIQIHYESKNIHFNLRDSVNDTVISPEHDKTITPSDYVTLDQLTTGIILLLSLQKSILLLLLYLGLKAFRKVIASVKNIKTFQQENVNAFRKIGKYAFFYFFIGSYSYYGAMELSQRSANLDLSPLIITLLAYILAEIFKEGNKLVKENSLTV